MTIQKNFQSVLGVSTLLILGACANGQIPTNATGNAVPQTSNVYTQYGVVQSIDLVQQQAASGSGGVGAGAIAGAVVGGILGNQVGGGSGKTAATVLGAAGGAYAGHTLEKNNQSTQLVNAYKFTVRLNNGAYQAYTQTSNADIRVGDRVQIDNGTLRRY
ncbi:glycine zipper 2TM domain-containing protein [Rhodoferax sp. 4810]|nr:glycine zipper 2TM domain-containing protein [Rhodoferax jenense]